MRQESILFTETRANNVIKAVEEAITSFTGTAVTSSVSVGVEHEPNGPLFIDIEFGEAQNFVDTLRKKLFELVKSKQLYKESAEFADRIIGSTYALLLSISGRSGTTAFTLDNAEKAARVERHMQPVRKRIHELLRVT